MGLPLSEPAVQRMAIMAEACTAGLTTLPMLRSARVNALLPQHALPSSSPESPAATATLDVSCIASPCLQQTDTQMVCVTTGRPAQRNQALMAVWELAAQQMAKWARACTQEQTMLPVLLSAQLNAMLPQLASPSSSQV